ncbi:FMN-binding glutamate synthase family protein [Bacillus benzoevorans]|uniref:Glutamate synthase domain-containing protein 2 n=1 Tax=Bacillus benzoevorans TaxID=1456 RepID=A0A7X0LV81_9BACI|nr:FMN-binding glutamate synthase family protein [Bacillus benzoevorans]MBB6444297.1 glutamate synthase domain-containing protein 2 [Bacillus benzoevorans]
MMNILLYLSFAIISIIFISILFFLSRWRLIAQKVVKQTGEILLTDRYSENILEIIPGFRHMGIQNVLENSLRAHSGEILHRPLGSSKKWPHLEPITFIPVQTASFPIQSDKDVDIKVIIGPKAKKPMEIHIPIMISGMAYGVSLSEQVRLSLAEAAKNTGTSINSGEGAVLPEELATAGKYVLQFSKAEWSKEEELLTQVDMIELKLGQGALLGTGAKIPPGDLIGRPREIMGLKENEDAVIFDNFFADQTLEDLKQLISRLRELTDGIPIGVKMGAGGRLEEDLDHVVALGVDFITIDGGQGGSYAAPPILADDMGIPTLHAVVRAANYLEKRKLKGQISLIVSGGLFVPGQFFKILALGADAVCIASAMLFAVTHTQTLNALPFEPPTQAVWNQGKFRDEYNREEGVTSAEKFLTSCAEEIKIGLRAMGKRSLKEMSKDDLVSYDELVSKKLGIPFSFNAREVGNQAGKDFKKNPSNF